jgi:hypothetical protein
VGCVTMTCWGASRNVGTSGGVNTGGAEPGVSSSSCKKVKGGRFICRTEHTGTLILSISSSGHLNRPTTTHKFTYLDNVVCYVEGTTYTVCENKVRKISGPGWDKVENRRSL